MQLDHEPGARHHLGMIAVLAPQDLDDDGRQLLWDATEADPAGLDRLLTEELPRLTILGVRDAASARLLGMVAYDGDPGAPGPVGPGPASEVVVIEYLAVAEAARGTGLGSRLLEAVATRYPGAAIEARTDDDAVEFYRASGFTVEAAARDPRWPERQRYRCRRASWRSTAPVAIRSTIDRTREVLDAAGLAATYREVEQVALAAGWTPCGAGDWAFALASPDGQVVVRISPFDPVGPYTARLYREAASTGLVPALYLHRRLAGGGDLQVMERLDTVSATEGASFLARLGSPEHSSETGGEPPLVALARTVARVHRAARRDLPWCGPLDTNPSNVMRAGDGRLVLTDPYYADGPDLYATAERDPDLVVARIPEEERRFMTEIPLSCSGPWKPGEAAALRAGLREADRRRARESRR
ncbi:GNAT family N-acetyltransferase [Salana multivorans]